MYTLFTDCVQHLYTIYGLCPKIETLFGDFVKKFTHFVHIYRRAAHLTAVSLSNFFGVNIINRKFTWPLGDTKFLCSC